jgi:hypothetical protein
MATKKAVKRARRGNDLKKPVELAGSAVVLKGSIKRGAKAKHAKTAKRAKKQGRAGVDWVAAGKKAWATRQANLARVGAVIANAPVPETAARP